MSVENVNKFKKELVENKEVKEKVEKELESFKDSGKKERDLIPDIARKLGYDFTDEEFKEANKIVSDEELSNVSGGKFWCGEDAPDGHELDCILTWYHGWQDYYFKNKICENCKSTHGYYETSSSFHCWDCGHNTKEYGSGYAHSGGSY